MDSRALFNNETVARHYEATAPRLIPGYEEVLALVARPMARRSPLLVVGAGLGAEIALLQQENPSADITALEPAAAMRERGQECFPESATLKWMDGTLEDLPESKFAAISCLFVAHFVADKSSFFSDLCSHLDHGGEAWIADFIAPTPDYSVQDWAAFMQAQGLPDAVIKHELSRFETKFHLCSEQDLINLWANFGLQTTCEGAWGWTRLWRVSWKP